MSDMTSNRISVRIPDTLASRLRSRSRAKGRTESEVIRQALEEHLEHSIAERTAFELAEQSGIVGALRKAPKDLSSNRRHFREFGKSK